MSNIYFQKNKMFFKNIRIDEVLEKHKTPFYLYSKDVLTENFLKFKNAALIAGLDKFKICFAVKSNANIQFLKTLRRLGSGCDIVSGGELDQALKAGFKGSDIVFSGVGKSEAEITKALRAGVYSFNVESIEELEMIYKIGKNLKKKPRICFRLNPQVASKTHKHISTGNTTHKFGILSSEIAQAVSEKKWWNVCKFVGLSIHIGSQLTNLDATEEAIHKLCLCAKSLDKPVEFLDVGGGLGVAYEPHQHGDIPDQETYMLLVKKAISKHFLDIPEIVFEPGRVISASAGVFVTSVIRNKKSEDYNFLIVDGGMNDFVRPSLYGAYHEIYSSVPVTEKTEILKTEVVGPICETADCFAHERPLPKMKAGDFIIISDTGAYGHTMSSNYNMRNRPKEYFI